jgi:hypothetical protein
MPFFIKKIRRPIVNISNVNNVNNISNTFTGINHEILLCNDTKIKFNCTGNQEYRLRLPNRQIDGNFFKLDTQDNSTTIVLNPSKSILVDIDIQYSIDGKLPYNLIEFNLYLNNSLYHSNIYGYNNNSILDTILMTDLPSNSRIHFTYKILNNLSEKTNIYFNQNSLIDIKVN